MMMIMFLFQKLWIYHHFSNHFHGDVMIFLTSASAWWFVDPIQAWNGSPLASGNDVCSDAWKMSRNPDLSLLGIQNEWILPPHSISFCISSWPYPTTSICWWTLPLVGNLFSKTGVGLLRNNQVLRALVSWLVVSTPLKNISQLGLLFPIYGKIKNVPNHQPVSYAHVWVIISAGY